MEETNSDVDEGNEAAPHDPAAANGASSASSFYDPERPPFEERPVQSVQDRVPAAAALPADGFDADQASQDRKRICSAVGAAAVALMLLRRRRRRRHRRT